MNEHLEPLGLTVRITNTRIYPTTADQSLRGQRFRDIQRIQVLDTQDRVMNITIARIVNDALHHRHRNTIRDGEKPALAYAFNVGYLRPDTTRDREITASPALLDAFPDL